MPRNRPTLQTTPEALSRTPLLFGLWLVLLIFIPGAGMYISLTGTADDDAARALLGTSIVALIIGFCFAAAGAFIAIPTELDKGARLIQRTHFRTLITAHVVVAFSVMTFIAAIGDDSGLVLATVVTMLLFWISPGLLWAAVTADINRLQIDQYNFQLDQHKHPLNKAPTFPR